MVVSRDAARRVAYRMLTMAARRIGDYLYGITCVDLNTVDDMTYLVATIV
jgi:hypothetical protein